MTIDNWKDHNAELFRRWLSEVEQEIGHPINQRLAQDAWEDGYSVAEYVIQLGDSIEADCICGWSCVNSASIDPPDQVTNKHCPIHGNAAARDPDAEYERRRDDAMWEDR